MRRLFWVAMGATAGILIARALTKKAQALTSTSIGQRASGVADGFRAFADDVRAGMAERESELAAALGLTAQGQHEPDLAALRRLATEDI